LRLLVAICALLILLLAADAAARAYADSKLSDLIATSLDAGDVEVDIHGFPFLADLVRGRIERVDVSVADGSGGATKPRRLRMRVNHLAFSLQDTLSGRLDEVRVRSGTGTAELSLPLLERSLRRSGRLIGDISLTEFDAVSVRGTTLKIGPIQLDLPTIAPRMTYTSARVADGTVELAFELERTTISI
jgi:hypothetical protein